VGDVALVSDAGTPALSDPGFELVCTCLEAGFAVSSIPGPSAPVAALVASGLPTDQFFYLGFLPRRSSERRSLLHRLSHLPATLVCFEAPHRITDTLADALAVLGDRRIVVARELTKLHEEWLRMRISQAQEHFLTRRPRGEFTLLIEGATRQSEQPAPADAGTGEPADTRAAILQRLEELRAMGERGSAAARTVAREFGLPKQVVYDLWLALPPEPEEEAEENAENGDLSPPD
jgi:16S rRNA (cytidine1402-2'-O)-methyltransferase